MVEVNTKTTNDEPQNLRPPKRKQPVENLDQAVAADAIVVKKSSTETTNNFHIPIQRVTWIISLKSWLTSTIPPNDWLMMIKGFVCLDMSKFVRSFRDGVLGTGIHW
nr:hypothetical protein [Tanacetum cinerariifolium]